MASSSLNDAAASRVTEFFVETPASVASNEATNDSLVWSFADGATTSSSIHQQQQSRSASSKTICTHAFAVGSHILHYTQAWKTSLEDEVLVVTSNADGSVIVGATASGSIYLLRGRDGVVLAKHKIHESIHGYPIWSHDMGGPPAISWITKSLDGQDAFWLEGAADASCMEEASDRQLYIYVGGIYGQRLNSIDPEETAKATRELTLSTISLPSATWRAAVGYFSEHSVATAPSGAQLSQPRVIRIVACQNDGYLAVYDYDMVQLTTTLVKGGIALQQSKEEAAVTEEDWCIDYELGLRMQEIRGKRYVLVAGLTSSQSSLFWFDPVALESACEYMVEVVKNSNPTAESFNREPPNEPASTVRPKVLALEPLESLSESLAVAMAVMSPSNGQVNIQVIRVLTEETFGLTLLSKPHAFVELASADSESVAYNFCFKVWLDASACKYFTFTSGSGEETLGDLRSLLEMERFDELDVKMNAADINSIVLDPSAVFSLHEVAFKRFQSILSRGCARTAESLNSAQLCLRQLADGAATGQLDALDYLLKASDHCTHSLPDLNLAETRFILRSATAALEQVSNGQVDEPCTKFIDAKHHELNNRALVHQFLESVVECEGGENLKMTSYVKSIRSPRHLFSVLIEQHLFSIAEQMWRSQLCNYLTPEVLVGSILKIAANVSPKRYVYIVKDAVFASLSIGHELLGPVLSWVCRTADGLDDCDSDHGLADAIYLLEAACGCLNRLQIQVHESFAISSPFLEPDKSHFSKRAPLISNNRSTWHSSRDASTILEESMTASTKSATKYRSTGGGMHPNPTLLQLGVLGRGAIKTRINKLVPADPRYDNDICVENKLREARCLHRARLAGLDKKTSSLRSLAANGGPQFVALQLVSLLSTAANGHANRFEYMSTYLRPFCDEFNIDYDSALQKYITGRCGGTNASKNAISESASLVRCCQLVETKAKTTLIVLQSALQCGYFPDWLSALADDGKAWAAFDSELQSKVQEAWRLLSIMSLVVKYCGDGAREVFRIDNPRHARRLVDFMTQHVHQQSVLEDVFTLCNAFVHLNIRESCCALAQHAVLRGDEAFCCDLMAELCARDLQLGESVVAGSISFLEELLAGTKCLTRKHTGTPISNDTVHLERSRLVKASHCTCSIVAVMMKFTRTFSADAASELHSLLYENGGSLECLRNDLLRICRLQTEFAIFLSLTNLQNPASVVHIISDLLKPVIAAHSGSKLDLIINRIAMAKRASYLLVKGPKQTVEDVWLSVCAEAAVGMVNDHYDGEVLEFLRNVGLLEQVPNRSLARAHLAVANALCDEARMSYNEDWHEGLPRLFKAAILVRNYSIASSFNQDLGAAVSLGSVVDIACQMCTRGDEGVGEQLERMKEKMELTVWNKRLPPSMQSLDDKFSDQASPKSRQSLHKEWYIGDGLLLPPMALLEQSFRLCRTQLSGDISVLGEAVEFLRLSGAHSLVLRLLYSSASHLTGSVSLEGTPDTEQDNMAHDITETLMSLAERSLGGSCHTGKTSSIVDSQLASACLLSLPPKDAVDIYKASLPTALKTKDFERTHALANVGTTLCCIENDSEYPLGGIFSIGWKGRERFYVPCQQLARRSLWWSVLDDFRVDFDTQFFESSRDKINKQYVTSLFGQLIQGMYGRYSVSVVLKGCFAFASAFGVNHDEILREHVRFLLVVDEQVLNRMDSRCIISACEKQAKRSLRLLQPPSIRCEILRECVCQLESLSSGGQQYSRIDLALCLYQSALEFVLDSDPTLKSDDVAAYERDYEKVCRRRDALSILSSVFCGERAKERPSYPLFFLPFESSGEPLSHTSFCGILGLQDTRGDGNFDPLKPLSTVLGRVTDTALLSSLGPLCLSLGLPTGYIHARALVQKFESAKLEASKCPAFESDVVGTLARIRSHKDQVELLEWCAQQYGDSAEDRLKSLDAAYTAAIEASGEIEKRRQLSATDNSLDLALNNALATLKRIDLMKSSLSDRLRAVSLLQASVSGTQDVISCITDELIKRLGQQVKEDLLMSADTLVTFLLTTSSKLAADACLCDDKPLSMDQFRQFRATITETCRSIADQYSHIDLLGVCKRLAWRWLFYGNSPQDVFADVADETCNHHNAAKAVACALSEETVDFVMDLSVLLTSGDTKSAIPHSRGDKLTATRYTSDEEQSAVKPSSAREQSEFACRRESLRIAFILSFEDVTATSPAAIDDIENKVPVGSNIVLPIRSRRPKLLSNLETKRENPREVMISKICSWLLTIVFAKPGQTSAQLYGDISFAESNVSYMQECAGPGTVTFAMRHRALRTAAVLCPQEALERVIYEEGFLRTSSKSSDISLRKCAFASFVAKEIEDMGLPLPHSDFDRLGSMQFPSYARTLWRHHRDDDKTGQRGRLLLLLIEMSLKGESSDANFVNTLLDEMISRHLPRSLLLAIERIVLYYSRHSSQDDTLRGRTLSVSIEMTAKAIFTETHRIIDSHLADDKRNIRLAISSISRLADVLFALSTFDEGQVHLQQLVDALRSLSTASLDESSTKSIHGILSSAMRRLAQTWRSIEHDDEDDNETVVGALSRLEASLLRC
ncbi:hypothetical protein MPSEU_000281700 [Mayamaea pseudoterrestris]|nr:hypothetical protein MPSEU_000281700 [Mayamaea pseudoterrestris]